jgi:tRNA-Thr(GGU) m(6)t(6)A37 methyltransferase TsaA
MEIQLRPIGTVRSALTDPRQAPKQGAEGAPAAWLDIDDRYAGALAEVTVGDQLIVLTWLHLADRDTLVTHPRGDTTLAPVGVFSLRSEDRPNPIGLHRVSVVEIAGGSLRVEPLEAVDGTPVIDLKPVLDATDR